jgi:hypothetical protein
VFQALKSSAIRGLLKPIKKFKKGEEEKRKNKRKKE